MEASPVVGAFFGGVIGGIYAVQSLKAKMTKRIDDLELIIKHNENKLQKLEEEVKILNEQYKFLTEKQGKRKKS